jgi:hypothetical protein
MQVASFACALAAHWHGAGLVVAWLVAQKGAGEGKRLDASGGSLARRGHADGARWRFRRGAAAACGGHPRPLSLFII